ncbi:DUF1049 domain-containing protein [bacterium]|nr:DUF1049 domain-containing protein [bacterium]
MKKKWKIIKRVIIPFLIILVLIPIFKNNNHNMLFKYLSYEEEFSVRGVILYSFILGVFISLIFTLPSLIIFKIKLKKIQEELDQLSDKKAMDESVLDNDEKIE